MIAKRRGRPPLENPPEQKYVVLLLPPSLVEKLRRRAKEKKWPLSQLVRGTVERAMGYGFVPTPRNGTHRVQLRMPLSLHQALESLARQYNVSLNHYVRQALEEYL